MRKIQEMMKGFLKRLKHTGSPWRWEHGRWRSSSAATRAAGWPGATPAPSSGCRCRRGWWWRRAARSKRGKGKRCKTGTTAPGWAPASQCSRPCRKVLDRSGPTGPRAPPQTQMHNTTPPPPGDGRETKRTCYLKKTGDGISTLKISFTPLLKPPWPSGSVAPPHSGVSCTPHRGLGSRLWGSTPKTELSGWSDYTGRTARRTWRRADRWSLQTATCWQTRRGEDRKGWRGRFITTMAVGSSASWCKSQQAVPVIHVC